VDHIVAGNRGVELDAGFTGLVRTARLEDEKFRGRILRYAPAIARADLLERLVHEVAADSDAVEVRYAASGERTVKRWTEIAPALRAATGPSVSWQAGDVIWITGGLGGLGQICARHFALTPGVKVVLTGRSAAEIPAELRTAGKFSIGRVILPRQVWRKIWSK